LEAEGRHRQRQGEAQ